jgi:putative tryptophan/tyrosine transport system substrate-binding protein
MIRREFIRLLGGAAAAWPLTARGQQPAMPVIGFMSGRSPEDSKHLVAAFRQGLSEAGFVEGQNIVIEYRWGLGQYDRMPALAADLVNRRVAVLVGVGGDISAVAAKQATSTIPIVFGTGSDPIKAGMVESLSRPGGNATGYSLLTNQMEPKRLSMLHDLMPGAAVIGVLLNPNFPPAARQLQDLEEAARTIGQQLFVSKASNDGELSAAFTSFVQQRVGALLVAADPYFDTRRDQIIAFAKQNRLPAIYQLREYAVAGGLISYGPSITDMYRQAGIYTGRILKGARPADLPVVQPTKFDFVINLKTAKALGLTVPPGLLNAADEVIE